LRRSDFKLSQYLAPPTVRRGLLMAYHADPANMLQRMAALVDQLLRGAKPADIPIEQPTKFGLTINVKTAKALGIAVPQSLLTRADEAIE